MHFLKKIFGSTPPPEPSSEEKILRAILLLEEKKVTDGLTQLLDKYLGNFGQVVVEKVEDFQAKPNSPLANKKIQSCTSFTFKNRKVELLLVDVQTRWDEPSLYRADLFVVHDGECVLCIDARESRDMGGSKYWSASVSALRMVDGLSTDLKIMKVGSWMDDLAAIVDELGSQRAKDKKDEDDCQKQSLEKLARDIDLGEP
jgi:hypothetical protein